MFRLECLEAVGDPLHALSLFAVEADVPVYRVHEQARIVGNAGCRQSVRERNEVRDRHEKIRRAGRHLRIQAGVGEDRAPIGETLFFDTFE